MATGAAAAIVAAVVAVAAAYQNSKTQEQAARFASAQGGAETAALQADLQRTKTQASFDELQRQQALLDMISSQDASMAVSGLSGGSLTNIQTESFKRAAQAQNAADFATRAKDLDYRANIMNTQATSKYNRWLGKRQAQNSLLQGLGTAVSIYSGYSKS